MNAPMTSLAGGALPPPLVAMPADAPRQVRRVIEHLSRSEPEYRRCLAQSRPGQEAQSDLLFGTPRTPHAAVDVFPRLRWGGLFVFVAERPAQAEEVARDLAAGGFVVERGPAALTANFLGLPFALPVLSKTWHYVAARKVLLLHPGDDTDRFTYHVQLERNPGDRDEPWVVVKEVPTVADVVARLRRRFGELPLEVIEKRARKFTEKIMPTFITREAAFLKILQEHLPPAYARRVPRCLGVEKDERGFVRKLKMNWLRLGGEPLSQMEFAHQSADLLRAVHDVAQVIHLDLRLDNFVITPDGVGFVDFGSAVRVNENLAENPLLGALFDELMRTSHIQQMLEKMTISGEVTSKYVTRGYQRVDKAVDFFYLAVQFNQPHANPDLAGLIRYDPDSEEARRLEKLTAEVLRPSDPEHPQFRSAKDILHGIERLRRSA